MTPGRLKCRQFRKKALDVNLEFIQTLLLFVCLFVCLFVLMLNVQVNNFSVMSGRSHRFLGITSTFRGVNVSLLKDTHGGCR